MDFIGNIQITSLSLLIFAPILFALVIASPWFPDNEIIIRRTAKSLGFVLFIYSLLFLVAFDPDQGLQFIEKIVWTQSGQSWISSIGVNYAVGVDGISLPLVILTTFITLLALFASKRPIIKRHKFYYSMVFILTSAVLGVFCAQDLFLFFLFWELELIPMYFLISIWGSGRAQYSATKFVLYTLAGSVFMLAAILLVYFNYFQQTGILTFSMQDLGSYANYPFFIQMLCFVGFFIAFSVKLPVVPFHTWLPDAHVDAPTPISMILAGILLKMGGYGLIRFNVFYFPEALKVCAPYIAILALISIIYGAMVALSQDDMKKLVAYSSVSHMGIVLLGISALNAPALNGAMFQMLAHGVISAGLFMLVGTIYLRTHTRQISQLGGLANQIPVLSGFFFLIALAGLGLPLLVGFAAETLVFYGAFVSNAFSSINLFGITLPVSIQIITGLSVLGIIITAAYVLFLIERVLFGPMFRKWKGIKDARYHEIFVLSMLSVTIVIFGLFPRLITGYFEPVIDNVVKNKLNVIALQPDSNCEGVNK